VILWETPSELDGASTGWLEGWGLVDAHEGCEWLWWL
jgi:hypothetical protein